MIYIAYIILSFAILQCAVALINVVFRQRFSSTMPNEDVMVSVLIPARNEEKNIGNILKDIISQSYHNIEIRVLDDASTDATALIVESYATQDNRIKLLQSNDLPKGWLGKNYACYQLAKESTGRYLLFLDADVRIEPDFIGKLLHYGHTRKLDLVSIFPKQILGSVGEWITVPIMNYILLSLLPLILVRGRYFTSLSAANGQCMFFSQSSYEKMNPHEQVKENAVEDIIIARMYKKKKLKIACLASARSISCRMYEGYEDAINGFSKNYLAFFGNSIAVAILFWLTTSFSFLVLLFYPILLGAYLLLAIATRIMISITSHQSVKKNLYYWVYQQRTLGILIKQAYANKRNRNQLWKDRNIYQ